MTTVRTFTTDIDTIVDSLKDNKRIITLDNVFMQFINLYDVINFNKLLKNIYNPTYTIYCLGISELLLYSQMNEDEMQNLNSIIGIENYTFRLKRNNNTCPEHIYQSTIDICITQNKILRDIIHKIGNPIISFNANIYSDLYYTNIDQLLDAYVDTDIDILYDEKTRHNIGLENSVLSLDNTEINVIHRGLMNNINDNTINGIQLNDTCVIPVDFLKKKYISQLSVIDININYPDSVIKLFKTKYMDNSVFIDFNKQMLKFQHMYDVYVDISPSGCFKEAVFNLYNILHQIKDLKYNTLLLNNIDFNGTNSDEYKNDLKKKYEYISNNKMVILPYSVLIN